MARGKLSRENSGPVGIEGREYKLLLDPDGFAGAPEKVAARFWTRHLKPLIEGQLDGKDGGASRAEGELQLKKRRVVTFIDSKRGILDEHDFALRSRTLVENGRTKGTPEVTLKFRSPDLLLSAEYYRAAKARPGDTTLEEDIAPLQVARGKKAVAVPDPPSTYSRFAVSTKRNLDGAFETLGDVFAKFEMAKQSLDRNAGRDADGGVKLVPGPTILECVFQDAAVDLGAGLDAEFGFTLWYFPADSTKGDPWERAKSGKLIPGAAEISFDFETENGRMDADAAERARTLFVAMQEKLPVNRRGTSKTKLGLPTEA
jgi:hypothetical protein